MRIVLFCSQSAVRWCRRWWWLLAAPFYAKLLIILTFQYPGNVFVYCLLVLSVNDHLNGVLSVLLWFWSGRCFWLAYFVSATEAGC